MLPFLDKKRMVGSVMARRGKPDTQLNTEVEAPDSEMDPGMKSACEEILAAIEHKSPMDLAKALKSFHSLNESSEGENESE